MAEAGPSKLAKALFQAIEFQTCGSNVCVCDFIIGKAISHMQPQSFWTWLLHLTTTTNEGCSEYKRLQSLLHGNICTFTPCIQCIHENKTTRVPEFRQILGPVVADLMKMVDHITVESCVIHGSQKIPQCLGDVPKVMLVTTRKPLISDVLSAEPLRLKYDCDSKPIYYVERDAVLAFLPSEYFVKRMSFNIIFSWKSIVRNVRNQNANTLWNWLIIQQSAENIGATLRSTLTGPQTSFNTFLAVRQMEGANSTTFIRETSPIFPEKQVWIPLLKPKTNQIESRRKRRRRIVVETDSDSEKDKFGSPMIRRELIASQKRKRQKNHSKPRNQSQKKLKPKDSIDDEDYLPGVTDEELDTEEFSDCPEEGEKNCYDDEKNSVSTLSGSFIESDGYDHFIDTEREWSPGFDYNIVDNESSEQDEEEPAIEEYDRDQELSRWNDLEEQVERAFSTTRDTNSESREQRNGISQLSILQKEEMGEEQSFKTPFLRMVASKASGELERCGGSVVGPREAEKLLGENKLSLLRTNLRKGPKVDPFVDRLDTKDEGLVSLSVHCDIDSMDLLTYPLGGTAFNRSLGAVLLVWQTTFMNVIGPRMKNNGFVLFRDAYNSGYPGDYFGEEVTVHAKLGSFHQRREPLISDPLQVTILQIYENYAHEPIRVSAAVPSGTLLSLLEGRGCLLNMFFKKSRSRDPTAKTNPRVILHQFVWYILTEMILFFASLGTRDGEACAIWSRQVCCAIPDSKSNATHLHDRKSGPLSDYQAKQKLSSGSLTVALALFARHQRALEQDVELNDAFCCRRFLDVEKYRLPEELLCLVNPAMVPVLQADIGSTTCLQFFRKYIWDREKKVNDLISLQRDPGRLKSRAMPCSSSNKRAAWRGTLTREDLLPFSVVILRTTIHGMKAMIHDVSGLNNVKRSLMSSFSPDSFIDGTIDIAYVMHGPTSLIGSGLAVYLNRTAIRTLLPFGCRRTQKELGAYISTAPGFPRFAGYMTRNGCCGEPRSCIFPRSIRKVKSYVADWQLASTRGKTIYDCKGPLNLQKLLQIDSQASQKSFSKCVELLSNQKDFPENWRTGHREYYEQILHNVDHRMQMVTNPNSASGVRVEYTCFVDKHFTCLDEVGFVLEIKHKRESMKDKEFRRCFREHPQRWPWWTTIPSSRKGFRLSRYKIIFAENLPVLLIPERSVQKFSLTLERKLVELSREVYERGLEKIVNQRESQRFSRETDFLRCALDCLGTRNSFKLVSIIADGLLDAAHHIVDGYTCRNVSTVPINPRKASSFICATVESRMALGFPAVILSRLFRLPSFRLPLTVENPTGNPVTFSFEELREMSARDDLMLPESLWFQVMLRSQDVRSLEVDRTEGLFKDRSIMSTVSTILTRFTDSCVRRRQSNKRDAKETSFKLAALFTRLLISDIARFIKGISADQGKGFFANKREESDYKERFPLSLQLSSENLLELANIASSGDMWPQNRSLRTFAESEERNTGSRAHMYASVNTLTRPYRFSNRIIFVSDRTELPYESIDADNNGFVTDEAFFHFLWDKARSMFETSSTSMEFNKVEDCSWLSILAMRSTFEILRDPKHLLALEAIREVLVEAFSKCLRAAGFGSICPALRRHGSAIKYEGEPLWGLPLSFVRIRFLNEHFPLSLSSFDNIISLPHELHRDASEKILSTKRKLLKMLAKRNKEPIGTEKWVSWTEEYVDICKSFWKDRGIRNVISSCLRSRFNEKKEKYGLTSGLLSWANAIVEFILKLREALGDEGMGGCYVKEQGAAFSYQTKPEAFRPEQLLKKPWQKGYPHPREFLSKKEKASSLAFFTSPNIPLFFKTKGLLNEEETGVGRKNLQFLLVEDVEDLFGMQCSRQELGRCHSQWRLASTATIVEILEEFLSRTKENRNQSKRKE